MSDGLVRRLLDRSKRGGYASKDTPPDRLPKVKPIPAINAEAVATLRVYNPDSDVDTLYLRADVPVQARIGAKAEFTVTGIERSITEGQA